MLFIASDRNGTFIIMNSIIVSIRSAVVERVTHVRMYAGSIPTGVDHREELI